MIKFKETPTIYFMYNITNFLQIKTSKIISSPLTRKGLVRIHFFNNKQVLFEIFCCKILQLFRAVMVVIVQQLQSVPITTKVVSSNLVHGKVYLIQHYVIKFVSDLRQVDGFLRVFRFPPPIKLTTMITIILLKVALNTIALTPTHNHFFNSNKFCLKNLAEKFFNYSSVMYYFKP